MSQQGLTPRSRSTQRREGSLRPLHPWREDIWRLPTLIVLLVCAGCLKRETAVQAGNRDQILHRGMGSDPTDLDPHFATNIAEIDLASALFEGLVTEDPVDLHPVPGVAARRDSVC